MKNTTSDAVALHPAFLAADTFAPHRPWTTSTLDPSCDPRSTECASNEAKLSTTTTSVGLTRLRRKDSKRSRTRLKFPYATLTIAIVGIYRGNACAGYLRLRRPHFDVTRRIMTGRRYP